MIEGNNISVEYRQQEDLTELRKKAKHVEGDFDKVASELDKLKSVEYDLQNEMLGCDSTEMTMIYDFDRWIVYYNDVAASRLKELQKKVKEIRKRRAEILKELTRLRPKICMLESKCAALSYKQGELYWENRLQSVKKRKWKGS